MTAPDDPTAQALTLKAHLDGLEEGATAGPWAYNSYAGVDSVPLIQADDAWEPDAFLGRGSDPGWRLYYEEIEPRVATVPALAGDTATGRHAKDAAFIVALRNDWPAVSALLGALVERVRELDTEAVVWLRLRDAAVARADALTARLAQVYETASTALRSPYVAVKTECLDEIQDLARLATPTDGTPAAARTEETT